MKTIIKKTLRAAKRWLEDDRKKILDNIEMERKRFGKFAYGQLNANLLEIIQRTGGAVRPHYTWAVLHAANLAKTLGLKRISAIEFGVAGGWGLISLERTAEEVEKVLGVTIDVFGFDTGVGLPKPIDNRDLPNLYEESTYPMDPASLKARLKKAKLNLGLIEKTLPDFINSRPAPVGFMAVDVDLYSSTLQVFKLLEADPGILLPRIHCYCDDIAGFTFAEFNGERLAIKEFNDSHNSRKVSPIYGLRYFVPKEMVDSPWVETIYLAHILDHEMYSHDDGLVLNKHENL